MKHLFFGISLVVSIVSHSQSPKFARLDIEDNGDYSSLQFLDATNNRFYFTSEFHYVQACAKQFLKVFKYLYDKKNVRTIVLERGNSIAYLLNKYLESGDTSYLRKAVSFREEFDMYIAIKKHIGNNRIQVVGNDAERWFKSLIYALWDLAMHTNLRELDSDLWESLQQAANMDATEKEAMPLIASFKKLLEQPDLKASSQVVMENIAFIVNNPSLKNGKSLYVLSEKDKYQLLKLYTRDIKEGNFLSQYGAYHTELKGNRWAHLLNESDDSPFKGSVFSMGVHFYNTNTAQGNSSVVSRKIFGNTNTFILSKGNLKKKDAAFFSSLNTANHFIYFPEKDNYNYNVILIHKNQGKMQRLQP